EGALLVHGAQRQHFAVGREGKSLAGALAAGNNAIDTAKKFATAGIPELEKTARHRSQHLLIRREGDFQRVIVAAGMVKAHGPESRAGLGRERVTVKVRLHRG